MNREFRYLSTTYIESKEWSYNEASPSNNIDNINVPVLMVHGDLDLNVDVNMSISYDTRDSNPDDDVLVN